MNSFDVWLILGLTVGKFVNLIYSILTKNIFIKTKRKKMTRTEYLMQYKQKLILFLILFLAGYRTY